MYTCRGRYEFCAWLVKVCAVLLLAGSIQISRADEEFSEPEAEDFAYPVPWLKAGPVKQRMDFSSHRNLMLRNGWEGSAEKALAAAKVEYDAVKKLCSDDPRIDYAYGLVLWKYDKRSEAIRVFDAAARLNGNQPPFLPAAQAAAWARLLDGQRVAGLKQIVAVATVLNKSKGSYPTQVQKEDSAMFLGRAVEFLSGPGRSPETFVDDKRLLDEVASLIPVDFSAEFQAGRDQIGKRHAELKALAARPAAEIEAENRRRKQEIERQLEASRSESDNFTADLEIRGDNQKKRLKDQTQQIGKLTRDLAQIQSGLQSASREVARYQNPERHYEDVEERVRVEDERGRFKGYETKTKRRERPETSSERSERLRQLSAAQSRGNTLLAQREKATVELDQLQDERRQSNVAFQKRQKELRTDRGKQFRTQRELAVKLKQIERDYVSPEELKSRVNTIAPYVPWDPDLEREALLASYRVNLPDVSKP